MHHFPQFSSLLEARFGYRNDLPRDFSGPRHCKTNSVFFPCPSPVTAELAKSAVMR